MKEFLGFSVMGSTAIALQRKMITVYKFFYKLNIVFMFRFSKKYLGYLEIIINYLRDINFVLRFGVLTRREKQAV
jgi:hypothetical protein